MPFNRNLSDGPGPSVETTNRWNRKSWESSDIKLTTKDVTTSVTYKITRGQDIPNYHRRKRRGELMPMTHFYQCEADGRIHEGSHNYVKTYSGGGTSRYWTDGVWWPDWDYCDWQIRESYVKPRAYDRLSDDYVGWAAAKIYSSGFDGLTFAAELTKTIAMFKGFLRRWAKLLSQGRIDKIWLEGRYGWRTLYYDILDINKAIARIDDGRRRFREQAGASEKWSTTDYYTESWSAASITYAATTSAELNHRAVVIADIKPPKIIVNPAMTAWELMSYSFVVDWVVQIGSWLESMTFLMIQNDYVAAKGLKLSYSKSCVITDVDWGTDFSGDYTLNGSSTCVVEIREPAQVPLSPSTKLKLDKFKVLDLVALTLGKIRR